jgi:thiol-disulfide isomerase/thioredoxin
MIRKLLLGVASLVLALAAAAGFLYLRNSAPAVQPISTADVAQPSKPFVIKLHARWCPVCMLTTDIWARVEQAYAGRVHFVVFDFSNEATTDASRAEARRLGLERFFDENEGWTGTIAVLNGRTKDVVATIHGSRDLGEYRAAIDAGLQAMH